jgi:hypothetical protein
MARLYKQVCSLLFIGANLQINSLVLFVAGCE